MLYKGSRSSPQPAHPRFVQHHAVEDRTGEGTPMSALALYDTAITALNTALATPTGIVALCSAGIAGMLVIVSSFVKTMIPLRCLAIGGNLGFLIYGALHPSLILVLLHGA